MILRLFALFVLVCFCTVCFAQADSQSYVHSPRKATLRSAFVPGWGQVYNKKYWKVPVIYAGFGVLTYAFVQNNKQYQRFKNDYIASTDGDSTTIPSIPGLNPETFRENRDFYQRYRDLAIIGMAFWWAFQVIDANVDAHLYEFYISPDLSLRLKPSFTANPMISSAAPGLKLQLKLKR